MDDLLSRALNSAQVRGASYADIRVVRTDQERYGVRNGVVETVAVDESFGFGVRVLVDGSWGFASSSDVNPSEIDRITGLAVQIGKASSRLGGEPVNLGPPVTSRGAYITPVQVDPFTVPPEEKLALLMEADAMMGFVKGVRSRQGNLIFIREHKSFANTEGAFVEQTIFEAGGGIQVTAVGQGEVQRRSYPQSPGRQQGCCGLGVHPGHGTAKACRARGLGGGGAIDRRSRALLRKRQRSSSGRPNSPSRFTNRAATR